MSSRNELSSALGGAGREDVFGGEADAGGTPLCGDDRDGPGVGCSDMPKAYKASPEAHVKNASTPAQTGVNTQFLTPRPGETHRRESVAAATPSQNASHAKDRQRARSRNHTESNGVNLAAQPRKADVGHNAPRSNAP